MRDLNFSQRKSLKGYSTWLDQAITVINPVWGLKRQYARMHLAKAGGYSGASTSKRSLSEWAASYHDADGDILPDLGRLRTRSRDLARNNPLAGGALNTKVSNVVGSGLMFRADIDNQFLNLSQEQEVAWEDNAEREFRLWAESTYCDVTGLQNFYALQALAFRSLLENGDVFVLLPSIENPGWPYTLSLQLIEADRVCNADNQRDTETLSGGIERDKNGKPLRYHIMNQHPGSTIHSGLRTWNLVAANSSSGRRRVIHLMKRKRIGQNRGVPDLAPIMHALKQLGDYTEAEIDAAVVNAMFAVFITTESGVGLPPLTAPGQGETKEGEIKLSPGLIASLRPGEKISSANTGRPNTEFNNFVTAILRQIGMALEIPYEVLIKHFTSSYSASRGALNEAWKYFKSERVWFAQNFSQPIYEEFLFEAVTLGRIPAPGFIEDVRFRKAYSGAQWIGPAKGQIDELKEANAVAKRLETGLTTLDQETAEMNGGNWVSNHAQQVREKKARVEGGLVEPAVLEVAPAHPFDREEQADDE